MYAPTPLVRHWVPRRHHPFAALAARVRAPWLDRQLRTGVPPWSSPVHAARALQLTGTRRRLALARALDRLVARAERPPVRGPYRSAVVEPCRAQVRDAVPTIRALSTRLRGRDPIGARGVASLNDILSDSCGPCYRMGDGGELATALENVALWLDVPD
jgi:hypothetical protein